MPEGDTVHRTAARLDRALAGHRLTRSDFRHPALATVDLAGRDVLGAHAVGKHLFLRFSGGVSLHSHLRMDGSWRVYTPGERWRAPARQARVVLDTAPAQAVGFHVHELRLVSTDRESSLVGHLGPDLLAGDWSIAHADRAARALRARPDAEIGTALLDQRIMAGLGNVYRTEVCFLLGVSPWTPVSEVDADRVVALARSLLTANVSHARRSTTGEHTPGRRTWVHERERSGCLRCGGRVRTAEQGAGTRARRTWFCPRCQPGPAPVP